MVQCSRKTNLVQMEATAEEPEGGWRVQILAMEVVAWSEPEVAYQMRMQNNCADLTWEMVD